ncbi:MAG: DUF1294 domain-containing protein [Candidatus Peribacteria bacterium]|jgi:uncharacterized membrane protein YsdA (DUF1294 family)|nr:DUF1294 domain-containing protein [Candidatus Peribacteria bacterium]
MRFFRGYFLLINLATFTLWGIDKRKAVLQKWRISEKMLLSFCAFGGRVGALLAMGVFRHKTIKTAFLLWFYLIVFLRAGGLVLLYLFFN